MVCWAPNGMVFPRLAELPKTIEGRCAGFAGKLRAVASSPATACSCRSDTTFIQLLVALPCTGHRGHATDGSTDPATAATWNADYVWYDAGGSQILEAVPNANFQNLSTSAWYRWETDINFRTGQITEVRITDIAANTTFSHQPVGRYLRGGTAGGATPTGFRFFAGGGVVGNTLAFDNPALMPDGSSATVITGCGNNPAGSLSIDHGVPAIGTTVALSLDNPTGAQGAGSLAAIVLGLTSIANPCGAMIPGFGMSGPAAPGELLIGAILPVALSAPAWSPGSPSQVSVSIPNNCGLIGSIIYLQGIIIDIAGPNVFGLSEAVELVLGN